jgi:hypothetical protein
MDQSSVPDTSDGLMVPGRKMEIRVIHEREWPYVQVGGNLSKDFQSSRRNPLG